MKVKGDIFYFEAGKYVIGDLLNLFDEKDIKKMKATFSRAKTKYGLNKKFNFHYFKGDATNEFEDYIDKGTKLLTEVCLMIVPEENVKSGRLSNCKRLNAKSKFTVKYITDKLGSVLYFNYPNEPGPFMMLVQDNDA